MPTRIAVVLAVCGFLLGLHHAPVAARPAVHAAGGGLGAAPSGPGVGGAPGLTPDDPWWGEEWGLAQIGLPALWRRTVGDSATVIAVVDTGVDPSRPDLAGALLPGEDVTDGSAGTGDTVGHGTFVAEIAVGRGDDGVGAAGVCWRCRVLPVRVAPQGPTTAEELARGIRFAAEHGANVINVSFVLSGPDPTVAAAVAYAQQLGALVVAAAGNDGSTGPTFPASLPGVVGVVATDGSGRAYPWSTHGPWATVAAPGCATVAGADGRPTSFCGSSAAAPVVSGLAGLLWSAGLRSAARIREALASSSTPLAGGIAADGGVDAAALAAGLPR